jgi:hypothetical protein
MAKAEDVEKIAETIDVAVGTTPPLFVELTDGTKVNIYKCKTKHTGMVLRLISNIMRELGFTSFAEVSFRLDDPSYMAEILAHTSEEIFEVAIQLCDMSKEHFMELELDDTLKIVMAEFQLNKDFFSQRVLPIVQKELQKA